MRIKTILMAVILLTALCLKAETELIVSAAASLKNAFTEIKDNYEKEHPDVKVLINFAASGQLQAQIEMGAPVDIFAAASAKEVDNLVKKNLIDKETVKIFAVNELVLIKSKNNKLVIKNLTDLQNALVKKIAIGNLSTVPVGKYAMQALGFYKLDKSLQDKFIPCENVRQVLDYVERNEVDAGFVYSTDAKIGKNIEIVSSIPSEAHDKIVYPVGIIKTSKSQKSAQEFIDYVLKSKTIFKKYGFKD